MINIKTFVFNGFQENTFVLFDETKECIIIDAGCYDNSEKENLVSFIENNNLKPVKLVNTHGHIDHLLGVNFLRGKYNIPFEAHKLDEPIVCSTNEYAELFGFSFNDSPTIDNYLNEIDEIKFGNSSLEIFHVPGHSPGSLAFYSKSQEFVIVGDVLFNGSIGRTDLPGGDYDTLIHSIKTKLLNLPENVEVLSGHGNNTSIAYEKKTNPFLI